MAPGASAFAVHERDAESHPVELAKGWLKVPVDSSVGAQQLEQRLLRIGSEESVVLRYEESEIAVYCAEGNGWASLDGNEVRLRSGSALLVPVGTTIALAKEGRAEVSFVMVLSPPPGGGGPALERPRGSIRVSTLTTHEDDRPDQPAGDGRRFKVLIDPEMGCRTMTQFVGFIERSKPPSHSHSHEEAIYVVEGEGILHTDGRTAPIEPGTSIFLPPGTPHCLENDGEATLKVLGVFSPPGSPADRKEEPS